MSRSWKRSDGMSYRDWGRVRKERALVADWKQQLQEEREVSEQRVFIIVNEWESLDGDTSSEVVGGKWFPSEDHAWGALYLIAESYNIDLNDDETSLQAPNPSLESDEYRIEELTKETH